MASLNEPLAELETGDFPEHPGPSSPLYFPFCYFVFVTYVEAKGEKDMTKWKCRVRYSMVTRFCGKEKKETVSSYWRVVGDEEGEEKTKKKRKKEDVCWPTTGREIRSAARRGESDFAAGRLAA